MSSILPRHGLLATVRNRRGLITGVEPFDGGTDGRVHLVTVEYLDADGSGEDTLIWEREPQAELLEPTTLPDVVGAPEWQGLKSSAASRTASTDS